ncbi:mCG63684, partial [Mus musculus]
RVCQVRPSSACPRCPGSALLPEEPRNCPPGASEESAAGPERRGAQVANGPPCLSRRFSRALVAPQARPPDLSPPQTRKRHYLSPLLALDLLNSCSWDSSHRAN